MQQILLVESDFLLLCALAFCALIFLGAWLIVRAITKISCPECGGKNIRALEVNGNVHKFECMKCGKKFEYKLPDLDTSSLQPPGMFFD